MLVVVVVLTFGWDVGGWIVGCGLWSGDWVMLVDCELWSGDWGTNDWTGLGCSALGWALEGDSESGVGCGVIVCGWGSDHRGSVAVLGHRFGIGLRAAVCGSGYGLRLWKAVWGL